MMATDLGMIRRRTRHACNDDSIGSVGAGFTRVALCYYCLCVLLQLSVYAEASKGLPTSMGAGRAHVTGGGKRAGGIPSAADRTKRRSRRPSTFAQPDASDDKADTGFGEYEDSEDDDGDWWEDEWSDKGDDWSESDDEMGTGEGVWKKAPSGWGSPFGRASQMLAAGSGMTISERMNNVRRRASRVYREAKSLMSSEMEGVVLKATRPDDFPVKPKHLEALMRPTTEMPKEFNVYLPVVRKLWSKMTDKEWRVATKAVYIVHRFAADGSATHATNLKQSVMALRTQHDSRRKVKYFDLGTICDVRPPPWSTEDVAPFAEFLKLYAEYVLQRTTQFGPGFAEMLDDYAMIVGSGEVLTAASALMLAGRKCVLRTEQETSVTVAAVVQVVQDLRDLMEVCAAQLDFLLREGEAREIYPAEVDRWYGFLYENVEHVAALVRWANELATRHDLSPMLRPLVATPIMLKMRDDEMSLLGKEATEKAAEQQQECAVVDADKDLGTEATDQPIVDGARPQASAGTIPSSPIPGASDIGVADTKAHGLEATSVADSTDSRGPADAGARAEIIAGHQAKAVAAHKKPKGAKQSSTAVTTAPTSKKLSRGNSGYVAKPARLLPEAGKEGNADGRHKRPKAASASGKSSWDANASSTPGEVQGVAEPKPARAQAATRIKSRSSRSVGDGSDAKQESSNSSSSKSRHHRSGDASTTRRTAPHKVSRRSSSATGTGDGAAAEGEQDLERPAAVSGTSGSKSKRSAERRKGPASGAFASEKKHRRKGPSAPPPQ